MHTTNYTGGYANGVQWYFPTGMSEISTAVDPLVGTSTSTCEGITYLGQHAHIPVVNHHPAESLVLYGHQCDGSQNSGPDHLAESLVFYGHQCGPQTDIGNEGWNYPTHQQYECYNSVSLHQGVTNFNVKSGQTSASGNQTSEAALSNNLNSETKPTDADNKAKGQPRRGRPPKYQDPNGSKDGDKLLWVFEDAATMRRVLKRKHTSRSKMSKKKGARLVDRQGL